MDGASRRLIPRARGLRLPERANADAGIRSYACAHRRACPHAYANGAAYAYCKGNANANARAYSDSHGRAYACADAHRDCYA